MTDFQLYSVVLSVIAILLNSFLIFFLIIMRKDIVKLKIFSEKSIKDKKNNHKVIKTYANDVDDNSSNEVIIMDDEYLYNLDKQRENKDLFD